MLTIGCQPSNLLTLLDHCRSKPKICSTLCTVLRKHGKCTSIASPWLAWLAGEAHFAKLHFLTRNFGNILKWAHPAVAPVLAAGWAAHTLKSLKADLLHSASRRIVGLTCLLGEGQYPAACIAAMLQ